MYLLKQNVLEKGNESEPMRAIALLEGILETLQPGGAAEMQSLQAFVRNLRPVCSAKEGLSVLRRWRLARSRAIALALPQVAPFEELGALGTLAQNLEKRHDRLRTMLSLLRTRPEIIRPTPEGVDMMISLLDQQFQLLHADEQVKTSRRGQEDDLDPTAKKGKGKDGKGKGSKGTGKDSAPKGDKQECMAWKSTGKCRFGDRCRFTHGNPLLPEALRLRRQAQLPSPKAAPAVAPSQQPCLAWNKNGKCRFGDKCKYSHDGDAKQAETKPQGATTSAYKRSV